MDKGKLKLSHNETTTKKEVRIDCNRTCTIFTSLKCTAQDNYVLLLIHKGKKATVKFNYPTLDVHGDKEKLDKLLLDARTYLCSTNKCLLCHTRSHQRMTNYNIEKIRKLNSEKYITITKIVAEKITNFLTSTEEKKKTFFVSKRNYIKENNTTSNSINNFDTITTKEKCLYCRNPKISGTKHIHFIKSTKNLSSSEEKSIRNFEPIESIFDKINNIAEENSIKLLQKPVLDPPKHKLATNSIRMTYGDINYLGSNKAIFYFDRGHRGKQIFTNSMLPLKNQPKYKDIVVIDEIVFTSTCKCESSNQHKEMFPHFRVTCAVGLTCPARLNKHERLIYARNKNATTETPTTARSMLIRYWC